MVAGRTVQDVRVDLRGGDDLVPDQLLNRADVATVLEQMRRERVPQGVTSGALGETESQHGGAEGVLDDGLVQVVPAPLKAIVGNDRARRAPVSHSQWYTLW